jgi:hypothetical protein
MCGWADVKMMKRKKGVMLSSVEAWWAGLYAISFDKLRMTALF